MVQNQFNAVHAHQSDQGATSHCNPQGEEDNFARKIVLSTGGMRRNVGRKRHKARSKPKEKERKDANLTDEGLDASGSDVFEDLSAFQSGFGSICI